MHAIPLLKSRVQFFSWNSGVALWLLWSIEGAISGILDLPGPGFKMTGGFLFPTFGNAEPFWEEAQVGPYG